MRGSVFKKYKETGILDKFPDSGLKVLWRTPIKAGYTGPAVANGRVFVLDWEETQKPKGTERALALDEKTGKILWTREWQADYRGISWPTVCLSPSGLRNTVCGSA